MKKLLQIKTLVEVYNIIGGGTPPKDNPAFYSGNIPWASVWEMREDLLTETEFRNSRYAAPVSDTIITKLYAIF
jgi:type I restriction enzyme S subunit